MTYTQNWGDNAKLLAGVSSTALVVWIGLDEKMLWEAFRNSCFEMYITHCHKRSWQTDCSHD